MSEVDTQATNILLPEARVAVFSHDRDTLEAAGKIPEDWRFARVSVDVREGDVDSAKQLYAQSTSPDLLIVQTDNIDEAFTVHLEELASRCDEGTAAIVVGPVNDVYLYRRLIEMGVSDYLVKPIETAVLSDVIAKTLIEKKGVTASRLIAVIGAKGGVGTTVISQALAWSASDILGQKTMLLDAAGGWSTLSVGMGFEPATTLNEAARAAANLDEDGIKRMLFRASDTLNVLASGGDVMLEQSIEPDQMEPIIDMFMSRYPAVLFDLSGADHAMAKMVIARANEIVVVSTPTLPSLRLARSLMHEIKDLRGGDEGGIEMIVNMQGVAAAHEVSKKDIQQAMDFKIASLIPFLPKVFMGAESESRKISNDKEGVEVIHAHLIPLLQRVLDVGRGEEKTVGNKEDSLFGGLFKKLKTK